MESIEYQTWELQYEYWQEKLECAKIERDYWRMKIKQLKEGK